MGEDQSLLSIPKLLYGGKIWTSYLSWILPSVGLPADTHNMAFLHIYLNLHNPKLQELYISFLYEYILN
jgi:hypothetical protein